jgi:MFS family permease
LPGLDLFVVNVAFNRIGQSFPGHTLGDLSWILNGYAIVYAALLIPLGPVVGGLLVEVSWRLIFLINVPVGVPEARPATVADSGNRA